MVSIGKVQVVERAGGGSQVVNPVDGAVDHERLTDVVIEEFEICVVPEVP